MRAYFVPHIDLVGGPEGSIGLGAMWLNDHRTEGDWLILVATKEQAGKHNVIGRLTGQGVPWAIPRNFPPANWSGGPVLAPWPSKRGLERINDYEGMISSVCVLKYLESDYGDWLTARRAMDVTKPNVVPASPTISDAIVLEAMKDVTPTINFANNLSTSRDRTVVIRYLQYLVRHGHELMAEEIVPWAMANGWTHISAEKLRDIVAGVNAGRTFRGLDSRPIRDRGKLLKRWREEGNQ